MPHPLLPELEILASDTAAERGYEVCAVQLLTHHKPITMQVQIRQIGGGDVSLDDCAVFSSPMGEAIEVSQIIQEEYVLEISSPGISDELKNERDFNTFKGFPVEVTIEKKNKSKLQSTGLLHERSNDHLLLNIKGRMKRIPLEEIRQVRLVSPTG